MRKGQRDPLTSSAIIKAAFPRDASKLIARHLGCTDRQAKRIASGQVPGRFKAALAQILGLVLEKNAEILQHHIAALKASDHAEMASRAADRRASADRQTAPTLPGLSEGTTHAPLDRGNRR